MSAQADSPWAIPIQIYRHKLKSQFFESCSDSCAPSGLNEPGEVIGGHFNSGNVAMVSDSKMTEPLTLKHGFGFFDSAQFFQCDWHSTWDS